MGLFYSFQRTQLGEILIESEVVLKFRSEFSGSGSSSTISSEIKGLKQTNVIQVFDSAINLQSPGSLPVDMIISKPSINSNIVIWHTSRDTILKDYLLVLKKVIKR